MYPPTDIENWTSKVRETLKQDQRNTSSRLRRVTRSQCTKGLLHPFVKLTGRWNCNPSSGTTWQLYKVNPFQKSDVFSSRSSDFPLLQPNESFSLTPLLPRVIDLTTEPSYEGLVSHWKSVCVLLRVPDNLSSSKTLRTCKSDNCIRSERKVKSWKGSIYPTSFTLKGNRK